MLSFESREFALHFQRKEPRRSPWSQPVGHLRDEAKLHGEGRRRSCVDVGRQQFIADSRPASGHPAWPPKLHSITTSPRHVVNLVGEHGPGVSIIRLIRVGPQACDFGPWFLKNQFALQRVSVGYAGHDFGDVTTDLELP